MALTLQRRAVTGETTGSVDLDESIFGIQPSALEAIVPGYLGTGSNKARRMADLRHRRPG